MATYEKFYLSAGETPGRIHAATVTEKTANKVAELLNINHRDHHIYFDDHGLHSKSSGRFQPHS
jgi:hypothetical protein